MVNIQTNVTTQRHGATIQSITVTTSLEPAKQTSTHLILGQVRSTLTIPRLSNANQSPVPVGKIPMLRHFHNPTASVNRLHKIYTTFCSGRVIREWADAVVGANGANADTRCVQE